MTTAITVVSAMASHLPTGKGSPISIHGLPALRRLESSLRSQGLGWVPLERFDSLPSSSRVLALWDFGSLARLPAALGKAAGRRLVAWSLESPLVAHRGYHHLPVIAERARHIVGYPGVADLIGEGAAFHKVWWPNKLERVASDPPWRDRKLVVMVNSNKRLHQWREGFSLSNPKSSARLLASSLTARSYRLRSKWQSPDLYNERLRAITELAQHPGFSLFGIGWSERLPGWSDATWQRVRSAHRGEVANKQEVLSQHRFALCIENTVFPGYISEKIFDAFQAGTIPVYLGAPDVDRYLPPGAFIDLRDFSSYSELLLHLEGLSETGANSYLWEARRFLDSEQVKDFSEDSFVSTMERAILETVEALG